MNHKKVPIGEVEGWKDNPKNTKKTDFERLKKQIKTLGVYKPLIVVRENGRYISLGGNSRLAALKALGQTHVDISIVEAKTQAKKIEYALSDNDRIGQYDEQALAELLQPHIEEIGLEDYRLDTGKTVDLVNIVELFGPALEDAEDEVPDLPEGDPVTQTGDLYHLGPHRILCADVTGEGTMDRLMGGTKADMVFTDPPYNVDYGCSKNPRHKIRSMTGDKQTKDEWEIFNEAWITALIKHYKGGDFYVWGASGPDGMRQRLKIIEMGFHWSATIVWKKQQLILTPAKYQRMYEMLFYGWLGKSTYRGTRKQVEVWEVDRPRSSEDHPTMKPIKLATRAIKNSSKPGDVVWDGFLGSGPTLIACERLGRVCYGMEIEPKYCDVTITRYCNQMDIPEESVRVTVERMAGK